MKTVYVLLFNPEAIADNDHKKGVVHAVFEDKTTAERMKREGDVVVEVPFFKDDYPYYANTVGTITVTGKGEMPLKDGIGTGDRMPPSTTQVWC